MSILRNLADRIEDRDLRPHQLAEGEELAFEIEERRKEVWQAWQAVNDVTTQLIQGTSAKHPATLAGELKQHARDLEKAIRQSASLLLEVANRLEGEGE